MSSQSAQLLERDAFFWIKEEAKGDKQGRNVIKNRKRHARVSVNDIAQKYGIPAQSIVDLLAYEIKSEAACRTLPFALLLVTSYAGMVIFHDNAPVVNAVEDSWTHSIIEQADFGFTDDFNGHKNIHDVHSKADFWSWLSSGYIPMLFQQDAAFANHRNKTDSFIKAARESVPRKDRGVVLEYNRVVLGVRLSQERYGDDPSIEPAICVGKNLEPLYNKECVGGQGYELEPNMLVARNTKNPTRVEWLYIHDDVDDVLRQVAELEKAHWADERTQKIEVAVASYNGEFGLHTMIMCDFFFSRGGKIWKQIIPMSTFADWHPNWSYYIFDTLWVLCILRISALEIKDILLGINANGLPWLWNGYITFWNSVDLVSIAWGMGIVAMFMTTKGNSDGLNSAVHDISLLEESTQRELYRHTGRSYWILLESSALYLFYFRMVVAVYPLVIVLKLFKAFHAQPRLAVVTRTLECSFADLCHFMLIFGSVFMTYAVAGVVLFGKENPSFTTLFRSVTTCFRMLQGDFDWSQMKEVGRVDASVWFLPFVVVIVLVLLNMLIAIIMDTYALVNVDVGHADSLWTQASKVMTRMYDQRRNKVVDLNKIKTAVEDHILYQKKRLKGASTSSVNLNAQEDEGALDDQTFKIGSLGEESTELDARRQHLVTSTVLKKILPEMKKVQRLQIMEDAIHEYYDERKESTTTDQLVHMVEKVDHRTRKLKRLQRERFDSMGRACDHTAEVEQLTKECHDKLQEAREEFAGWLPDDPMDRPLPGRWLLRGLQRVSPPSPLLIDPETDGDPHATAAVPTCLSDDALQAFADEVAQGKQIVAESLKAVNDLHESLVRITEERRRDVEKFNEMKERAMALARENRAQRETLQHGQVTLQAHSADRDDFFDKVKALMEENRELELELRLARTSDSTTRAAGDAHLMDATITV